MYNIKILSILFKNCFTYTTNKAKAKQQIYTKTLENKLCFS